MPPSERRKKITIQAGQICPLCREKVHTQEVLTVCPGCQAVYHKECSGELASGRCTTLGCSYGRRTGSGRTPEAERRPERPPPRAPQTPALTPSERTLRGAMACGVVIALVFLFVHTTQYVERRANESARARRHARHARYLRGVLAGYRRRGVKLRKLVEPGFPPASWRLPSGPFLLDDAAATDVPEAVVLTWGQLQDPRRKTPLDPYFPRGFREGLYWSSLDPSDPDFPKPAGVSKRVERALEARLVIAVRVKSLRSAQKLTHDAHGRVRLPGAERSYTRSEALERGLWPSGTPPHSQAEVVLQAYLYDLDADPSYKGCLEVRGRSPQGFRARHIDPLTGYEYSSASLGPHERELLHELQRSGLEAGDLIKADLAALSRAYEELAKELRSSSR